MDLFDFLWFFQVRALSLLKILASGLLFILSDLHTYASIRRCKGRKLLKLVTFPRNTALSAYDIIITSDLLSTLDWRILRPQHYSDYEIQGI